MSRTTIKTLISSILSSIKQFIFELLALLRRKFYNVLNVLTVLAPSLSIKSAPFLLVMATTIQSWMSLRFAQIVQFILALWRQKHPVWRFYQIFIKRKGNWARQRIWLHLDIILNSHFHYRLTLVHQFSWKWSILFLFNDSCRLDIAFKESN